MTSKRLSTVKGSLGPARRSRKPLHPHGSSSSARYQPLAISQATNANAHANGNNLATHGPAPSQVGAVPSSQASAPGTLPLTLVTPPITSFFLPQSQATSHSAASTLALTCSTITSNHDEDQPPALEPAATAVQTAKATLFSSAPSSPSRHRQRPLCPLFEPRSANSNNNNTNNQQHQLSLFPSQQQGKEERSTVVSHHVLPHASPAASSTSSAMSDAGVYGGNGKENDPFIISPIVDRRVSLKTILSQTAGWEPSNPPASTTAFSTASASASAQPSLFAAVMAGAASSSSASFTDSSSSFPSSFARPASNALASNPSATATTTSSSRFAPPLEPRKKQAQSLLFRHPCDRSPELTSSPPSSASFPLAAVSLKFDSMSQESSRDGLPSTTISTLENGGGGGSASMSQDEVAPSFDTFAQHRSASFLFAQERSRESCSSTEDKASHGNGTSTANSLFASSPEDGKEESQHAQDDEDGADGQEHDRPSQQMADATPTQVMINLTTTPPVPAHSPPLHPVLSPATLHARSVSLNHLDMNDSNSNPSSQQAISAFHGLPFSNQRSLSSLAPPPPPQPRKAIAHDKSLSRDYLLQQYSQQQQHLHQRTMSSFLISQSTHSLSASQDNGSFFCTPVDQAVRPKTDMELKEELQYARITNHVQGPVKKQKGGSMDMALLSQSLPPAHTEELITEHNPFWELATASSSSATGIGSGLSASVPNAHHSRKRTFTSHTSVSNSRFNNEFELLQTIGTGSFGRVMKVINRIDGWTYAVKCLKRPFRGRKER